ncbi:hypothetical protein DESC_480236 [Desulfosarcina cetonica]|uniref:hypothetical protein n=1 Tax=Desulfosarcina cetonica TaxID=90730 RepID=UPI0006D0AA48|nr:hypothetical protein [Desulfosarcina cetonica]VTR66526.1 hypothetical protein DESC_480236 [Desulfosarcina cetonica]
MPSSRSGQAGKEKNAPQAAHIFSLFYRSAKKPDAFPYSVNPADRYTGSADRSASNPPRDLAAPLIPLNIQPDSFLPFFLMNVSPFGF